MPIPTIFHNRLPHIAPIGASFFVTFNLFNSIPNALLQKIKQEFEFKKRQLMSSRIKDQKSKILELNHQYFLKVDNYIDKRKYGNLYLEDKQLAQVVIDKLKEIDGKHYNLLSYCIMPNHVHFLVDLSLQILDKNNDIKENYEDSYIQLGKLIKSINGSTSRACNEILGRKGSFWQKDYFDRYIRNEDGFWNVIEYILNNPVKAGLCKRWEDFPHSYINKKLLFV